MLPNGVVHFRIGHMVFVAGAQKSFESIMFQRPEFSSLAQPSVSTIDMHSG